MMKLIQGSLILVMISVFLGACTKDRTLYKVEIEGNISIIFSSDNRFMLVGHSLRDTETGREIFRLSNAEAGYAFSPSGNIFITVDYTANKLIGRDVQNNQELFELELPDYFNLYSAHVEFSPNSDTFFIASAAPELLTIWDTETGSKLLV